MNELEGGKLSELYRTQAQEMPSPEADAMLRAAARRAVGAAPQARAKRHRPRWFVPLLAAATLAAIAVGIVRVMPPEEVAAPRVDIAPTLQEAPREAPAAPAVTRTAP